MNRNSWWLRKHPGLWALLQYMHVQFALVRRFMHLSRHRDMQDFVEGLIKDLATQQQAADVLETEGPQIQNPKQQRTALRAASYFYSSFANSAAYLPGDLLTKEQAEKATAYAKRAMELYS